MIECETEQEQRVWDAAFGACVANAMLDVGSIASSARAHEVADAAVTMLRRHLDNYPYPVGSRVAIAAERGVVVPAPPGWSPARDWVWAEVAGECRQYQSRDVSLTQPAASAASIAT